MPRILWKGAISFGLVNVPVAIYPASQETGIDFDWLDKRSMDPVGYKRINKRTGKEIDAEDIVKGIRQDNGEYVVLDDAEIKAAYPVSTQTIDIETFVKADEIPFTYLEKPYYLAPLARADKVYALLREAMVAAGVVGVARVVMHNKERLAALIPDGDALLLNTIRWASEIRPSSELKLPAAGQAGGLKEGELKMAVQLVGNMTGAWRPDAYADRFTSAIHALAASRLKAGNTAKVAPLEGDAPVASNVVDLTELLRQSLQTRKPAGTKATRKQVATKKAVAKKAAPATAKKKAA